MNVSGGNSKEIFELFTNKLVFSVSVCKDEESEFLFSMWFISLSSNLKLSIDIVSMSVSHVFADFRFIFVKCSCSRRDGTSLFSLFYKLFYIFRALDCDQNATIFWECASKNLTWSHLCECMVCAAPKQLQHIVAGERFHWSCVSASVEPG